MNFSMIKRLTEKYDSSGIIDSCPGCGITIKCQHNCNDQQS